jgi:hypothetical protein
VRPLIPRVRVGDVLKGTRNLRYYLQTASTLKYLQEIKHGAGAARARRQNIYRPAKNDKFLVTVNAWGLFGVYNLDTEVILLFGNPTIRPKNSTRSTLGRLSSIQPKMPDMRMNPTIFSQWFIRTHIKMVDLRDWKDPAYYMRSVLHLNLANIRSDNVPSYYFQHGQSGIFDGYMNGEGWQRDNLLHLSKAWAARGATRVGAPTGKNTPGGGFGPRLEEIGGMKREIFQLCTNPRIAQCLKAEENDIYQAYSK